MQNENTSCGLGGEPVKQGADSGWCFIGNTQRGFQARAHHCGSARAWEWQRIPRVIEEFALPTMGRDFTFCRQLGCCWNLSMHPPPRVETQSATKLASLPRSRLARNRTLFFWLHKMDFCFCLFIFFFYSSNNVQLSNITNLQNQVLLLKWEKDKRWTLSGKLHHSLRCCL